MLFNLLQVQSATEVPCPAPTVFPLGQSVQENTAPPALYVPVAQSVHAPVVLSIYFDCVQVSENI